MMICLKAVMVSKIPIVTRQLRSTLVSFPIQMVQNTNLSLLELDLQLILEYNVVLNEVI